MQLRSLLTRRVSSAATDCRFGRLLIYAMSLLMLGLCIWKFASMKLAEPQLFFGILVTSALTAQCIGLGLLLPVARWKDRSRSYVSTGQIVVWAISFVLVVLGTWGIAATATTQYDVLIGLLLNFNVMMSIYLIAAILPLVAAGHAETRHEETASRKAA
jgi:hypothetical protein